MYASVHAKAQGAAVGGAAWARGLAASLSPAALEALGADRGGADEQAVAGRQRALWCSRNDRSG